MLQTVVENSIEQEDAVCALLGDALVPVSPAKGLGAERHVSRGRPALCVRTDPRERSWRNSRCPSSSVRLEATAHEKLEFGPGRPHVQAVPRPPDKALLAGQSQAAQPLPGLSSEQPLGLGAVSRC